MRKQSRTASRLSAIDCALSPDMKRARRPSEKGKLYILGAAAPHVESDFNQAVNFLTMAIDMFRNEKSHTSDAHISDPVRAHRYLSLSSLALAFLDSTKAR